MGTRRKNLYDSLCIKLYCRTRPGTRYQAKHYFAPPSARTRCPGRLAHQGRFWELSLQNSGGASRGEAGAPNEQPVAVRPCRALGQDVQAGLPAMDGSLPPVTTISGGASRDRTGDLLHAMQALSQLSYSPTRGAYFPACYPGCQ